MIYKLAVFLIIVGFFTLGVVALDADHDSLSQTQKFRANDKVWATTDIKVRSEPGLGSTQINSLSLGNSMIKGGMGIIRDGPISKDGYNWWKIEYDIGITGWSAENYLELVSDGPMRPDNFVKWSDDAIIWATDKDRLGSKGWNGECLRFVSNAFRQKDAKGESGYASATDAARALYRFDQEQEGWQHAPNGAVVFFNGKGSNPAGHVGIYLGDGKNIINAYGTVEKIAIADVLAKADVGNYLGWSYPPEAWRPKTSTASQPVRTAERTQAPSNAIYQDTSCLATVLMSEASVGTVEERVAVAWTIFNRVNSPNFPNTICGVVNQRSQYAMNQKPTQEFLDLAASLIAEPGADPTEGATHFFSPISMPKEGEATGGYDIGGGLHEVEDISGKVYFPSWSQTMESAGDITGVRPAYYMFYRERAANEKVTLTLYVHDGSADGPKISGAEVTGQDAAGKSFSQITDANGFVIFTGSPGSWQFTATKPGYDANSWSQEIIKTGTKHAYLFAEKMPTKSVTENGIQSTTRNVSSGLETSVDGELSDLINALKDKDAGVRRKAAEALGKLADARAVDSLIEVLMNDEDGDVRQMAAWALGQIDDFRTVDPLSYASVKDAQGYVRDEAYNALQRGTVGGNKVDSRSADPIIEALKDGDQGVRTRAAKALGQLTNATAVDSLIEVLRNDEDGDVRQMAAWALGEIGDVQAVDPLSYASVKDAQGYVRDEAKKALEKLGVQAE